MTKLEDAITTDSLQKLKFNLHNKNLGALREQLHHEFGDRFFYTTNDDIVLDFADALVLLKDDVQELGLTNALKELDIGIVTVLRSMRVTRKKAIDDYVPVATTFDSFDPNRQLSDNERLQMLRVFDRYYEYNSSQKGKLAQRIEEYEILHYQIQTTLNKK